MAKILTLEYRADGSRWTRGVCAPHIVSQLCRERAQYTLELTNYYINTTHHFLHWLLEDLEKERERKQVSILPSLITNGVVLDVEIALWPLNDIRPTMLQ
jgi:hypothetical protein